MRTGLGIVLNIYWVRPGEGVIVVVNRGCLLYRLVSICMHGIAGEVVVVVVLVVIFGWGQAAQI